MLAISFTQISPIAFEILGFEVYWYSLAYIFGTILGYALLKHLNKQTSLFTNQSMEDLIFYSILGIIIGGRLGYMIFYDFESILSDPIKIFKIRDGGMSFHGGLLGMIISTYLFCRKYKISLLQATDHISVVATIGLFLGRVANFINQEMYGKVTAAPWGVVFPMAGPLPRHPTQLYEALLEGFFLLLILYILFPKLHHRKGAISGMFLIIYGIFRIFIENYKDATDGHIWILTTGQALSIPMIILGSILLKRSGNKMKAIDINKY
ncbi:MAG: prolipoprotein diacylglyceryl transferase [Alphaproteobacteria bacterium]|jgi:phosphatidylglycerol:prolipoprotein diacylglycerol transferase|nr:prolipoprotein diacylglyceryl transferase [Candidatus Jidaibacter sp.]